MKTVAAYLFAAVLGAVFILTMIALLTLFAAMHN